MPSFVFTIVHDNGTVTSGVDSTGFYDSPEQMGSWYRERTPNAVEIRVWDSEHHDGRPVFDLQPQAVA